MQDKNWCGAESTCGPNDHSVGQIDELAGGLDLEVDGMLLHSEDAAPGLHLDAFADELLLRIFADSLIVCVEDMVARLHECNLDVIVQMRVKVQQVFMNEIMKLGGEFHPCWASAHYHKAK